MSHPPPDCVFCKIMAGQLPASVLTHYHASSVIVPLNPVTEGHVLVIPMQHVDHFAHVPSITAQVMSDAAHFAAVTPGYEECNLITSRGEAATQTVFHLHVHLVPRHEGDGLPLPWTGHHVAGRTAA
jgi:histidine triad (HIT) family protein